MNTVNETIASICQAARQSARELALASSHDKNRALQLMALSISQHENTILSANQKDLDLARQKNLSSAFLDRLSLNKERIQAMANGLEEIAKLPDPVGTVLKKTQRPNQLTILQVRVPIGVIGVIYESRPNVTADAAALCLKSSNAIILRGGSESFHSSMAIMTALHEGIAQTNVPKQAIQMVPTVDREAVNAMLMMDKYIDVIIPRGGPALIESIAEKSRIPLFKHLAGLCHTYIHSDANQEMARKIILNAKMRRTGICGATEVLLIDQDIAVAYLPSILDDLFCAGCEIRGDEQIVMLDQRVKLAVERDYNTEFLDAIIAVKIVKNLSDAIRHIAEHGTQHTDAIVTDNVMAAEQFLREVDSAIVMHNTSTQFADGGEFGMGAEIGIATGKLHARGPVGVEQLTTFKYVVCGNGQVRK